MYLTPKVCVVVIEYLLTNYLFLPSDFLVYFRLSIFDVCCCSCTLESHVKLSLYHVLLMYQGQSLSFQCGSFLGVSWHAGGCFGCSYRS